MIVRWLTLALTLFVLVPAVSGCAQGGEDSGSGAGGATPTVSLSIVPGTASIAVGAKQTFSAVLTDGTGGTKTPIVVWSSSDVAVATIDEKGVALGVKGGKATITATAEGKTATATITVTSRALKSLSVDPATANVAPGAKQPFKAQATYDDGTSQDVTATARWSSSDAGVAGIDAPGSATALKAGVTTITAEFEGQKASASLTVSTASLTSIEVSPPTSTIAIGSTQGFTANAIYSDGTRINVSSSVAWTSADPKVATITAAGTSFGVAKGTTVITATKDGKAGTAALTVSDATLTGLTIAPAGTLTIPIGLTKTFSAQALFSDGSSRDVSTTAVFSSSVAGRLTFVASEATAATLGTTVVTATSDGKTSNAVTVTVSDAAITTIAITPSTPPDVPIGGTLSLKATAILSSGSPLDVTTSVTWASSDTVVGTITTGGLFVAKSGGLTNITASKDGKSSAPVVVRVKPSTVGLTSISVTPATGVIIPKGSTQAYLATGNYSDGSTADITSSPATTWDVVDVANNPVPSTIATISDGSTGPAGVASGFASTASLSGSKAYARAKQSSVTGRGELRVRETTVGTVSVKCTGFDNVLTANKLLCLPQGISYPIYCTASAFYVDGTGPVDVTADATFSSSNTATLAFSKKADGKAIFTVVGNGKAVVIAAFSGVTSWVVGAPDPALPTQNAVVTAGTRTATNTAMFGPTGATMNAGDKFNYRVVATFGSATGCPTVGGPEGAGVQYDVTPLATFASTFTGVAVVSNEEGSVGLVSGVGKGVTDIGSSFQSINKTLTLTVLARCIKALEVLPKGPLVPVRSATKLQVNATYSDDKVETLTFGSTPGNLITFNAMSTVAGASLFVSPDTVLRNTYEFVSGTSPGTSSIVASLTVANGACGTSTVNSPANVITKSATVTASALVVTPASKSVPKGGSFGFSAKATYAGLGTFNVSVPSAGTCGGGCPWFSDVTYTDAPPLGFARTVGYTDAANNLCPISSTCGGGELVFAWTHQPPFTAGTSTVTTSLGLLSATSTLSISGKSVLAVVVTGSNLGVSVPKSVKPKVSVTVNYTDGSSDNQDTLAGSIVYESSVPSVLAFPTASSNIAVPGISGTADVTASVSGIKSAPVTFTVNTNELCTLTAGLGAGAINPMPKSATMSLLIRGNYGPTGCASISQPNLDVSDSVASSSGDSSTVRVTTDAGGTRAQSFTKLAPLSLGGISLTFSKEGKAAGILIGVEGDGCINGVSIVDPPANVTLPRGAPIELKVACTFLGSAVPCTPSSFSGTGTFFSAIPGFGPFASTGRGTVSSTATGSVDAIANVSSGTCGGALISSKPLTVLRGTAGLTSLSLSPSTATVPKGGTQQYKVEATYTAGSGAGTFDVTLAIPGGLGAGGRRLFSGGSGLVTFLDGARAVGSTTTEGAATLNADYSDGSSAAASTFVTLNISGVGVTGLRITSGPHQIAGCAGADACVPEGGWLLPLQVWDVQSDGALGGERTGTAVWTLEAPVASGTSLDATGLFTSATGISADTVQVVKAASGGFSKTFAVRMIKGSPTGLALYKSGAPVSSDNLPQGVKVQYDAQVNLAGAAFFATRNVNWSSDAAAVSIVASGAKAGLATAATTGSAIVSAKRGTSSSGLLAISVTGATATGFYCTPASSSVAIGKTVQIRVFSKNTFGADTDVTASTTEADYSGYAPNLVATSKSGEFFGVAVGTKVVSVDYLGLPAAGSATCSVTVTP